MAESWAATLSAIEHAQTQIEIALSMADDGVDGFAATAFPGHWRGDAADAARDRRPRVTSEARKAAESLRTACASLALLHRRALRAQAADQANRAMLERLAAQGVGIRG